jgi:membrane protease YdiL (CAAX protease family)
MVDRKPRNWTRGSESNRSLPFHKVIITLFGLLVLIRGATLIGVLMFPETNPQFILTLVLLVIIFWYLAKAPGPVYRLLEYGGFHPTPMINLGIQEDVDSLVESDSKLKGDVLTRIPSTSKGQTLAEPSVQRAIPQGVIFLLLLVLSWVPLNLGVALIIQLVFPMPSELEMIFRQLTAPEYRMETFILAVIIYPFLEELLCRGIVQDMALTELPPPWAIGLSSVFFAVMHWNIWQGVPAFITGLLLGIITLRSGNLRLAIIFHSLYNLLVLLIQWTAQNQLEDSLYGLGNLPPTPEVLLGAGMLLIVGIGVSSILVPQVLKNLSRRAL